MANDFNFVLIMTDTQGANMLVCSTGQPLQTPNLDRLAAKGVHFVAPAGSGARGAPGRRGTGATAPIG